MFGIVSYSVKITFSVFTRFLEVSKTLNHPRICSLLSSSNCGGIRYSEVKNLAIDYQEAKVALFKALEEAGCGHWIEKPVEQDQFSIWLQEEEDDKASS